jgi:Tfp pilus assembly protein PilV
MRTTPKPPQNPRGTSLIEAVIATSVLAVAVPLVFGAFAESGKTGISAEAETRSIWIIPRCMEEIQASREGRGQYFENTGVGQTFPTAGGVWAIAFSAEGNAIGKVTQAAYQKGLSELDGKPIRYIAALSATQPSASNTGNGPSSSMLVTCVSLEYPATSSAQRRQKVDFYSQTP